jgi:hypothetical protein
MKKAIDKIIALLFLIVILAVFAYFGREWFLREMLLWENQKLKQAITNLTAEDQIGYAKVISMEIKDGNTLTTISFVETARDDKSKTILEKQYSIAGDIVHFDALIIKFDNKMVMDGKERAMYLWRRVYGETMPPQNGLAIESQGSEPQRYADIMARLSMSQRNLFWTNIWDLANNPDKLKQYGITAIYGNAVYSRLQKGNVYLFKISPTGQLFIEAFVAKAPEM